MSDVQLFSRMVRYGRGQHAGHPGVEMNRLRHLGTQRAARRALQRPDGLGTEEAVALNTRAGKALAEGRRSEAEAEARLVIDTHANAGFADDRYLVARWILARILAQSGRHGEALEELTQFLDALPPVRKFAIFAVRQRLGLSRELIYQARYDEAETEARAAFEYCQKLPPDGTADYWRFHAVGNVLLAMTLRGLAADAESAARQAIREAEAAAQQAETDDESAFKSGHVLDLLHRGLAASLNGQGRYAEAEALLRDLLSEHPADFGIRTYLAIAQLGLGDFAEAEAEARQAEQESRDRYSPVHYVTLHAGTVLGMALARQGRVDEARRQLQDNAAAWAEHFGDAHPKTIAARAELANLDGDAAP